MADLYPSLAQCAIVATAFKILLFPAYKSTDFEVHRNWLAITHSLPVKEWYYEKTSEWTLDYPPFFAAFEWLLSQVAQYADPAMLTVKNLNYDSWQTIYFQRATVIISELVLVFALNRFIKSAPQSNKHLAHISSLSILLSPGLLIIDHIHFQYNGFMYGVLILSIVLARKQSTLLYSGITFAILLCMKHIHLYLSLAYFVYLLRTYCLDPKSVFRPRFGNIFKLGLGVISVFAVAFGPFIYWNQLLQLKDRLFPFSRGLCHAYWAPNIWAMYSFVDRALILLAPRLGLSINEEALTSVTRGLVGDTSFAVLPEVTKEHTFALTFLFQLLPLIKLWRSPGDWDVFVGAITLCGYASFLFGWHVHEKAVLLIIIPFSLIALRDRRYFSAFRSLAIAGHVSLFPLLFTAAEFPIKTVYTVFWLVLFLFVFEQVAPVPERPRIFPIVDRFSLLYLAVAIPLIIYCSLLHQLIFGLERYEFLPLMFMSSYSALGVVWVIPETNEVFTQYEPYLQRMDFYKQRRFICEITGHSGLTFFEALRSELEESREVNNTFPDALKEPILRRIQFSTVSRVDNLVDEIYEEFKQDFYPGEPVLILLDDNTRLHGMIRDKANFAEQLHPDGTVKSPAYATYLVKVLDRPNEEALLDQEHITRDRKTFTKQMLRAFIKNNVTRESWNGAPWLVKPSIAEEYRIPTEVPKHLQYGAKVAEKKAMKKADQEGFFGFFASQQLPELKPAVKGQKSKLSQQDLARSKEAQFLEYQRSLNGNPSFVVSSKTTGAARSSKSQDTEKKSQTATAVIVKTETPRPPSPPPIKYPIEDLDIAPDREKKKQRPTLTFLKVDETDSPDDEDLLHDDIDMKSVGLLLETWNTLNVYCEVFQLDSFTFDDFLQAMRFSSEDVDCELFVEVHCAVLKKLVNSEKDENGAVQISLPDLPADDSESDEEDQEEEVEETPEPEPVVTRMTTRSSLAKAEAENLKAQANRSRSNSVEVKIHRAAEMFGDYGWIDRLRKRDFRNGGWELVMVGLLHQLSARPRMEKVCNDILKHLAPLDAEPTQDTAQRQYATLDINLRVKALQIICMLSLDTKAIRNYLEECSNQMTEFRKEKIEYQKARKAGLEELRRLHQERKALQPEPEKSPSPAPELEALEDSKMTGVDVESDQVADTEEEEEVPQRSLRGGLDRVLERKRKHEEEQKRKEQLAKQPKGTKQYQRVLKKIDEQKANIEKLEEKIDVVDNDLREADCPRTRCLGKDRFCNRYWWFERNAMPYGGMPNSSTAEAQFANGRLWVQGPDEMERVGFIDVPEDQKKQYQKEFHTTPADRKKAEEGPTRLSNADEWGYYDDPDAVDKLIDWLDPRGNRELRLRKELLLHRDNIVKYMRFRAEYLAQTAERADSEEMPTKRMTTRNKTYVDDHKHRCLSWHNTTAMSENGHLHIDASRPTKRAKRATDDPKEIKAVNRQGKPLTRQGSRYHF
ncbi:Glycosyl transferase, ALG6/ALG8 [Aspergillus oryzae]|uniref:Glycosyl transferase, ALG6/ALG8 n=1 Tax=Aspergillus oryzae TaxID=5062 RepID=A0A1S9DSJ7_ASPOZ|nr:Glycosyl transferase, ALG6/ALG8 [Aspergillus oryzae]